MFLYDSMYFSLQLLSLEGCLKNRESEWRMRRTTSNSHAWTGTIPRVECHLATTTISFLCKIETMLYPSNPLISSNNTVSKQPHVANQQQKSKQPTVISNNIASKQPHLAKQTQLSKSSPTNKSNNIWTTIMFSNWQSNPPTVVLVMYLSNITECDPLIIATKLYPSNHV